MLTFGLLGAAVGVLIVFAHFGATMLGTRQKMLAASGEERAKIRVQLRKEFNITIFLFGVLLILASFIAKS